MLHVEIFVNRASVVDHDLFAQHYRTICKMKLGNTFRIELDEVFPHVEAAPIVEAVVHWRSRAAKWPQDDEQFSQLQEALRHILPGYPECRLQSQYEISAEIEQKNSSARMLHEWGFRLISGDGGRIVQFLRDGLVFSRLASYESWDLFVNEAWAAWEAFHQLTTPTEVERLAVRFINRFPISDSNDILAHLTCPPDSLDSIGLEPAEFVCQSRHKVPGEPLEINIVRAVQPPTPPQFIQAGLVIDVDVFVTKAILSSEEALLRERLQQMHWLKNKVFFTLLTDKSASSRKFNT